MRILLAEDRPFLGPDLKKGLEQGLYVVDLVVQGEDSLALGLARTYDLLVLDILLPSLFGLEVFRLLHDHKRPMPILLLTALGELEHRVRGLELGADDYLSKPFAVEELEARVRALFRRASSEKTARLRLLDLALDTTLSLVNAMLSDVGTALLITFSGADLCAPTEFCRRCLTRTAHPSRSYSQQNRPGDFTGLSRRSPYEHSLRSCFLYILPCKEQRVELPERLILLR